MRKNDRVQKRKEGELQLQKQRVEVEGEQEDQLRNQYQNMIKVLLEQATQALEQMQSFSADVYLRKTKLTRLNFA